MIVKDEEKTLERVLSCAKEFADEIVVVDTGSKDNSVSIAKKFTDKVFDFEWVNDFSKARNFSFEKATSDYIMWLDADDVIEKIDIKKLIKLKSKITNEDVFMLPYEIAFDENGKPTFSYFRERIVKNNSKFKFVEPIHEVIIPSGKIKYLNIPIKHKKEKLGDPKRNLNLYLNLLNSGYKFNPRHQFYFANELYYNGLFDLAIVEYEKFLKMDGFVENKIQAHLNLCRIFVKQNRLNDALKVCFDSFMFGKPKSEILCEIGHIYFSLFNYDKAIYWYKLAICKPETKTFAFVEKECYNYIPFIQLGICYYYLQNYKKAIFYNNKALKIKPNDKKALNNNAIYLSKV